MNLSEFFIRRPVLTTLMMTAILVGGILAYIYLPISSMPNVSYPVINVKVSFPGMNPETMANSVALPLEKELMGIPGLRLVSSSNTVGNTSIVLQFEIDKQMEIAAQDVQSAIIKAAPNLPANLPYGPTYRKVNPAEQPIIYLALTSETLPRTELYTYANTFIGQQISMLEGVSQVSTFGSVLAVRVQIDPDKLTGHDVTLAEVANAISTGNVYLASGQLDGSISAPLISIDGQLKNSLDYDKLIVTYRNGMPVRIADLGRSIDSFQNDKIYPQFIDAKGMLPSVTLAIQKEPDANAVAIADSIYALLNNLKNELPPALDLHVVYDRSLPIRETINDANLTLILAFILVVLVIYLFFGKIPETIIPAIVLPMSIIGTFIVMYLLGFTLDILSVLALTLAIGFIVDDAIVVLENVIKHVEAGESPFQASINGSRQILFTIISMTISLIAVFIPMLFMGGLIGKIFSEFAITLTTVTIISGLISLSLTPMLCSRFIRRRNSPPSEKSWTSKWSDYFNLSLRNKYQKLLVSLIHHKKIALFVGVACMLLTGLLFRYLPTDFTPDDDVGFFIIYAEEMEGGSSFKMLEDEKKLISVLRAHPYIESFIAISSYSELRKSINLIHLKPIQQRPPVQQVIQELYAQLSQIPGIQVFIKNIPLVDLAVGQESRGAYQIAFQSIYGDKIYKSAREMIEQMRRDPIFQGVNSDLGVNTPEIDVAILRDQASRLGISATDIENVFQYAYSGNLISRILTPIDQHNVVLELMPKFQRQLPTFDQLYLRSSTSQKLLPLSAVAEWSEVLGSSSISHMNQFPSVTISFNLAPGIALGDALERIDGLISEYVDPSVISLPIGAAKTFKESIKQAGMLLFLAVFVIYIVLGILYESFIHPITILTTLPPATLGGLLTLLIFGLPLSMYSYLGIILLIGIVKKNGIMIVDFAQENIRHRGMSPEAAIIDASLARFRPIMMTTAAAIFGALPIALGLGANAASRRPLGLVIIGGLFISQLITLFMTPILYLALEKIRK